MLHRSDINQRLGEGLPYEHLRSVFLAAALVCMSSLTCLYLCKGYAVLGKVLRPQLYNRKPHTLIIFSLRLVHPPHPSPHPP